MGSGWRCKRQLIALLAQCDQAHAAFLHHLAGCLGLAARLQPCVAGAQRGVPGKRQLAPGAEDAHAVVGPGRAAFGCGRQHKVASERLVQFVNACMASVLRPVPSSTTASGLPR